MRFTVPAVLLWVIFGLFVEWHYAEQRAAVREQNYIKHHELYIKRVKRIQAQNLYQAESKFVSCIENRPFVLGEIVYVPDTRQSENLTADSVKGLL
jgi:hypothetical protein